MLTLTRRDCLGEQTAQSRYDRRFLPVGRGAVDCARYAQVSPKLRDWFIAVLFRLGTVRGSSKLNVFPRNDLSTRPRVDVESWAMRTEKHEYVKTTLLLNRVGFQ